MNNLQKKYIDVIRPALKAELGYKNVFQVPKIEKIVINAGLGQNLKDQEYQEMVRKTIRKISGQEPIKTLAKKSISNFKIREGMVIGLKVTLRGARMWDFLEKIINVTLPRVRDFRGVSAKHFDSHGNYSLGFNEHVAFPEISMDEIESLHGVGVTITCQSKDKNAAQSLLTKLGIPFIQEELKK